MVRSEALLPPPPINKALAFGGVAAFAGAAAWALLLYFAHYEHGLLAWGVGGLVGFAVIKAGGYGRLLAMAAGGLALLSIGTGKQLAFQYFVSQEAVAATAHFNAESYDEHAKDASDWVALGANPSQDQVREFADQHQFDYRDLESFNREVGQDLSWFANEKPSLEAWREHWQDKIRAEASFIDYLKEDFHPLDIVFLILGVTTAFGMVSRATDQMKVAARQALRDAQAASAETTEVPAGPSNS